MGGEWWEVDLEAMVDVERVQIVNRFCGLDSSDPEGCMCRLSNAVVELYDESENVIAQRPLGDTCGKRVVEEQFSACRVSVPAPTSTPDKAPSISPSVSPSRSPIGACSVQKL